jgi:hypothetical protein
LGFLFIGTLGYHIQTAKFREPHWFGIDLARRPFYADESVVAGRDEHYFLSYVVGNASQAGLRNGDALLSVNGRIVTSRAVFGGEWRKSRPGERMTVSVARLENGQPPLEKTISFTLEPLANWHWRNMEQDILVLALPLASITWPRPYARTSRTACPWDCSPRNTLPLCPSTPSDGCAS